MLEIKNLHIEYAGGLKAAVDDVSFRVEKGDRIAILGPSGCGKTTLLNAIAGMLEPTTSEVSGELKWLTGKKPEVNFVFQNATLLPWRTVEKNIAFGLEIKKLSSDVIKAKVGQALAMIGLSESAKLYPGKLSVGMQQRVNFARAVACNPDLLLLDEPFSALDVETKKSIQNEFLKILDENKITSIFVTHNVSEAITMANKIIILSAGPARVKNIVSGTVLPGREQDIISNLEYYEE